MLATWLRNRFMRWLILCLLSLFPTLIFGQSESICNDPELNRRWEQAVIDRSQNRLIIKLSAKRTALCKAVQDGRLEPQAARASWEKTLMDALLANLPAAEEKQRRDLLLLFANFVF